MFCKSTKMPATAVKCSKRTRKKNIQALAKQISTVHDGYFTETKVCLSLKFTELTSSHLVDSLSREHNFQRNEARLFCTRIRFH